VLDVGGGNGYVTRALLDGGHQAALLEPGAAGIENARSRGVRPLIHATLDQARFRSGSVPAVGLFDVLEHIEDDAEFLAGLREILAPRGRLYVTVPAFGWLWSHADVHAGHYRRYTRQRLSEALDRVGFDVERATYFFSFLAPPMLAFRSLPDRVRPPPSNRQAQSEREHGPPQTARIALRAVSRAELAWLRRGRNLSLGSSLLAVGRSR
jgi:SAM-dependent methyltransferase